METRRLGRDTSPAHPALSFGEVSIEDFKVIYIPISLSLFFFYTNHCSRDAQVQRGSHI